MDPQFAEILKNTYTTVQFNHRLKVLKFFLTSKVFGGESAPDVPPEDLSWFNSLSKDFVSNFDADNFFLPGAFNQRFLQVRVKDAWKDSYNVESHDYS